MNKSNPNVIPVVVGNNDGDNIMKAVRSYIGLYINVAIYDAYHKAQVAALKGAILNNGGVNHDD